MKNFPHISLEKIADLIEGRLTSDEQARVLPHIADCDPCSRLRARVEHTVVMMRDDKAEDAPQLAIANAVNLFRSRKAPTSAIRRLLTSLSFDSLQLSPAFGMRAGETAERQLIFDAGENKVHLQVVPSGDAWIVSGQVLGPCVGGEEERNLYVEVHGGAEPAKAALGDSCEFTLPPLTEGHYSFIVRLSGVELEIPELKLGA